MDVDHDNVYMCKSTQRLTLVQHKSKYFRDLTKTMYRFDIYDGNKVETNLMDFEDAFLKEFEKVEIPKLYRFVQPFNTIGKGPNLLVVDTVKDVGKLMGFDPFHDTMLEINTVRKGGGTTTL